MEHAATLDVLVGRLYETPDLEAGFAGLYVSWLCIGSKTLDELASDANGRQFAGRAWARRDVRRAVERSRRWLEAELEGRGLLATEKASHGIA